MAAQAQVLSNAALRREHHHNALLFTALPSPLYPLFLLSLPITNHGSLVIATLFQ